MWQRGVAGIEYTRQVRLEHLRPLSRLHLRHVGEDADAGVVDENVETAEALDGCANGLLDIGVLSNVGAQRVNRIRTRSARTSKFVARIRQMRLAEAGDRDFDTLCGERMRDGEADAARAASDHRRLSA